MTDNASRIAKWTEEKEAQWADAGSSLRKKHPTRKEFDDWLERQTNKALRQQNNRIMALRNQRASWALQLSKEDQYEWFSNCYQLRCEDDYMHGGCNLHGPYNPDATPEALQQDFVVFCLLAARHHVIPLDWDWRAFLKVAAKNVIFAFEKEDAVERWGNAMPLRIAAEHVYGTSVWPHEPSDEEERASDDAEDLSDEVLNEIGGAGVWEQFLADISTHQRFQAFQG